MQDRELLALPDWSAVPSNSAEDCRLLNGTQVHEPPVPPSTRSVQAVPRELDEQVSCCLDKRPEGRPPSAAVLRARLAALQTHPVWSAADADAR